MLAALTHPELDGVCHVIKNQLDVQCSISLPGQYSANHWVNVYFFMKRKPDLTFHFFFAWKVPIGIKDHGIYGWEFIGTRRALWLEQMKRSGLSKVKSHIMATFLLVLLPGNSCWVGSQANGGRRWEEVTAIMWFTSGWSVSTPAQLTYYFCARVSLKKIIFSYWFDSLDLYSCQDCLCSEEA